MKIKPVRQIGRSRRGTLSASYFAIVALLGEPNVTDMDDPAKVEAAWGFEDEWGRKGFIWCYRHYDSPKTCAEWSIDGDPGLLVALFGESAAEWW